MQVSCKARAVAGWVFFVLTIWAGSWAGRCWAAVPAGAFRLLLGFGAPYEGASGRRVHCGADLAASPGEEGVSPVGGVVHFVGRVPSPDGAEVVGCVTVANGDDRWSLMPLERVRVSVGQRVEAGDIVGTLSPCGDPSSAETHLHLGLRRSGVYVDPMPEIAAVRLDPEGDSGEGAPEASDPALGGGAGASSAASAGDAYGASAALPPATAARSAPGAEARLVVSGGTEPAGEAGTGARAAGVRDARSPRAPAAAAHEFTRVGGPVDVAPSGGGSRASECGLSAWSRVAMVMSAVRRAAVGSAAAGVAIAMGFAVAMSLLSATGTRGRAPAVARAPASIEAGHK